MNSERALGKLTRLLTVAWVLLMASCERDRPPTSDQHKAQVKSQGFQLAHGVQVTNLTDIKEGYSVRKVEDGYHYFIVNVSAERLRQVFLRLAELVNEPGHLIIEVPSAEGIEKLMRTSDDDPHHNDVYYRDFLSFDEFRIIFERYSRFFIHCGLTEFGFGSGEGIDEVFVSKYKILVIYADEPDKYIKALAEFGFPKREGLKTVWSNFTKETPGSVNLIEINGKTVYDVVEMLEREGLYFAENRASH